MRFRVDFNEIFVSLLSLVRQCIAATLGIETLPRFSRLEFTEFETSRPSNWTEHRAKSLSPETSTVPGSGKISR